MIELYYWPTPNGWKITILLEELGLDYKVIPVNILKGEQYTPEFIALNPNNKISVLAQGPYTPAITSETPVHPRLWPWVFFIHKHPLLHGISRNNSHVAPFPQHFLIRDHLRSTKRSASHGEISMNNEARVRRQLDLEEEMAGLGIERYRKLLAKARDKNQESSLDYGQLIMRRAVMPVSEAITEFLYQ